MANRSAYSLYPLEIILYIFLQFKRTFTIFHMIHYSYYFAKNVLNSKKEDYYFSSFDVISALTDSKNSRNYWNMLKKNESKRK